MSIRGEFNNAGNLVGIKRCCNPLIGMCFECNTEESQLGGTCLFGFLAIYTVVQGLSIANDHPWMCWEMGYCSPGNQGYTSEYLETPRKGTAAVLTGSLSIVFWTPGYPPQLVRERMAATIQFTTFEGLDQCLPTWGSPDVCGVQYHWPCWPGLAGNSSQWTCGEPQVLEL